MVAIRGKADASDFLSVGRTELPVLRLMSISLTSHNYQLIAVLKLKSVGRVQLTDG